MLSTQDRKVLTDAQLRAQLNRVSQRATAWQQEEQHLLAEQLVRIIERQLPPPAHNVITVVYFQTKQYINGYFFDEVPSLYVTADQAKLSAHEFRKQYDCEEIDVGDGLIDTVNDVFGEAFGPLRSLDELVVNLLTRTAEIHEIQ